MSDEFFQPISGFDLPRFAGVPSFMRLPNLTPDHPRYKDTQLGLIGVPWDAGTTNRSGPRHGPRQMRDYSTMIRRINPATGIDPFALVNCADLGDVGPNPADLQDSLTRITDFYKEIVQSGITPMSIGGDHLCSLPILRALAIRGTMYDGEDMEFGRSVGVRIIQIEELFDRSIKDVMEEARKIVGSQPTYCSQSAPPMR